MPHSGAGKHNHFVKLRADSTLCSDPASGFDREARCLSDVIGSYPEDETDHWTAFDSPALIDS